MSRQITIEECIRCPFCREFDDGDFCCYMRVGNHSVVSEGRQRMAPTDKNIIPEWCPLTASPSPVAEVSVSATAITSLITRADSVMDCDLSLADMQYLRKSIADLFRSVGVSVKP